MARFETSNGMSDEEVLATVLSGNTPAFEVFMRRYSQLLYRVAVSIVRNGDEAEDIVQDTFVSAFQHLSQYSGRAKFSTWLTRIAVYKSLHRGSRRLREPAIVDDEAHGMYDLLADTAAGPERDLIALQRARCLKKAIASLPHNYRKVVVMRDLQEFDTRTTAQALGITEQNVKVRLHRAHQLLSKNLQHTMGQA